MGYTHYWRPKADIDAAVWERLTKATIGVLSIAKEMGVTIVGGHGEPDTQPEITDSLISLNGVPCHESLYLERTPRVRPGGDPGYERFAFCKTARKEYDVVVTAILCLAEHFSDGFFRVSSDGDPPDWQAGLELANKVVSGVKLPPRLLDPERED
jgi:hypothetical protein